MKHFDTHLHPTHFLQSLLHSENTLDTHFSYNTENSATKGIKNEDISSISPVPPKTYKNIRERLAQQLDDEKASSSSTENIVAKDKRKAAKVAPLPASLKKKQAVQLQSKLSPLI